MRPSDRSGIAVMVAVALAALTLRPLTSDDSYLVLGWLMVALLGGIGLVLRRLRMGGGTVLGAQSGAWALGSLALALVSSGSGAPWYAHYGELWAAGIEHMRTQASPMEPNDGVRLILVTVLGLILIMTDLLVSGIGRPAWALAPPATLFLVPALGLGADTGVLSFLWIAVGYLGILVAEGLNTAARWTRGLARDSAEGNGSATPVVWRATAYLAAPAIVAAILLGVALPTLSLPGIGLGPGGGGGPLQLTDPTLDLRRNLNQATDRVVIEYQSDRPGGVYLRMASLPRFDGNGWNNVQIDLQSGRDLSAVPGLGVAAGELRRTEIRVRDFGSQYLPLPFAPRSYDAPGDWRYDPQSLVVLNAEDRAEDLRGLEYSAQSADIEPSAEDLADATVGTPVDAEVTTEVPEDLPQDLVDLSERVTADARTPFAKAAAIQSFLRDGNYTYSLRPLPGNGYQALENFLLKDRQGYCEQFASAMAMMARVAGIPSRVAVGFLPGEQRGGDSWEVSIRKMHSWPELYFASWGWVRFEPTPAVQTGEAPPWTVPVEEDPTDDPTAQPSSEVTAGPSASIDPRDTPVEAPVTATEASGGWLRTVLWSGGGLVALLVLAAPATLRVRRRSARLSSDGAAEERVEGAWAEIRDTVVDHGGAWPPGSPRAIGREVSTRLESDGAASMGRVATLVERARYARTFGDAEAGPELPVMTAEIRRGIAEPVGPLRRLLAVVLPRSLFPWWRRSSRK